MPATTSSKSGATLSCPTPSSVWGSITSTVPSQLFPTSSIGRRLFEPLGSALSTSSAGSTSGLGTNVPAPAAWSPPSGSAAGATAVVATTLDSTVVATSTARCLGLREAIALPGNAGNGPKCTQNLPSPGHWAQAPTGVALGGWTG